MSRSSLIKPTIFLRLFLLLSFIAVACRIVAVDRGEERTALPGMGTAIPTEMRRPEQATSLAPSPRPVNPSSTPGRSTPTFDIDTPEANTSPACTDQDQAGALRAEEDAIQPESPPASCYELSLELSSGPDYSGSARVTYTNLTGAALDDLVFRLYPNSFEIYGGSLQVDRARVDGIPIEPEIFLEDRTGLRLPLKRPLENSGTVVVELEFSGRTPVDFGDSRVVYGVYNFDRQSQTLTIANWYPLLAVWGEGGWQAEPVIGIGDAVVSEVSYYTVQIQAPEGWQVVTTGSNVETGEDPDRRRLIISGPVRDFMVIASPRLVLRQAEVGGVQVNHWGLPGGEGRWEEALQDAVDSLHEFDQRFGLYPYRELDVVAAPLRLASGVEYPGIVLIADDEYSEAAQNPFPLSIVVSHEVAHQWWYGVVGNDVLENPWQDEALATFSSLVYQQIYQPQSYPGTLRGYRENIDRAEGTPFDLDMFLSLEAFRAEPRAYGLVVYLKGALFFVSLRDQIGDQAFYSALQSYYSANRFQIAGPQELLDAFEQACACELDAFYEEWRQ